MSELLSSRFVSLAVTMPVDTAAPGSNDLPDVTASWGLEEADIRSSSGSNGLGGGGSGGGSWGAGSDELRRDLELVVQGLLRLGEVEKVLAVMQDRVSEDLKLIIR